ncbi:PilZ domain-containing protein [Shewanella schlegeliana]|uniref:PilZ domain-containing protein n=1 Tax=Shewanella schlegeliana TaxID=190308 RepID=A0ABS1ST37_9GAMM|nr:PilZ domain-containing protein [Shewanella schlegeliana]MBL4911699.1 PilZ domain-containing protein [Shewanella schlegeliana]MCL1110349.1 PilZ domain-containing protein [Shewanella schlegeliana]GIU31325.1 pilus assembly protein PilZ [Shewanella schlegeliana]
METSQQERRSSQRVDMEDESVTIAIHSNAGIHSKSAICLDLSRRGALLEYNQALALGTLIEITFNQGYDNENTIKGQVCRCTSISDTRCHIALQLI